MIKDDNQRNGVQPSLVPNGVQLQSTASPDSRPSSQSSAPSHDISGIPASLRAGPWQSQNAQRYSMPSATPGQSHPFTSAVSPPPSQSKSQSVSFADYVPNGGAPYPQSERPSDDPLSQRFARLKMTSHPFRGDLRQYSSSAGLQDNAATSWYNPRDSLDHQQRSATDGSPPRPRVQVNTSVAKDLPKPPSPTYTPTRATGQPPRSARAGARVNVTYDRPSSVVSTSSTASQGTSRSKDLCYVDQRSDASDERGRPTRRRRKSIHKPQETELEAERLYDYLKTFNVLLIDVRSREEYDSGHIFSRSSMCVEPAALRQNMSAEELQEALVLAPDEEQRLFQSRDQFDVVVYYDQSTATDSWRRGRNSAFNPAMKYLQEALYDFNQEKPLLYAPILLRGGLDAWISLLGNQALQVSDTAHRSGSSKAISRRPAPIVRDSGLEIQKRRHYRDYNPLDPEEERKWRERARSESIVLDSQPSADNSGDSEMTEETPITQAYNEFNQRFPDVAAVEQQSGHTASPSRVQEPHKIPQYPRPPAPSQPALPGVPSRPAPAVPRPSYSGVSERVVSQATPITKPHLPPYIPPKLKRLPRTGLHNFSVTCYMNATIQCLSATLPLTAFFIDYQFMKHLQRDNWKGSKGLMPELYNILLRNLWQSTDVDTIRPTNFRVRTCLRLFVDTN